MVAVLRITPLLHTEKQNLCKKSMTDLSNGKKKKKEIPSQSQISGWREYVTPAVLQGKLTTSSSTRMLAPHPVSSYSSAPKHQEKNG